MDNSDRSAAGLPGPPSNRLRNALALLLATTGAAVFALAVIGESPSEAGEGAGEPQVLTTFTVVANMVENVAGDRVEVASITKPGAEIHGEGAFSYMARDLGLDEA